MARTLEGKSRCNRSEVCLSLCWPSDECICTNRQHAVDWLQLVFSCGLVVHNTLIGLCMAGIM